MGTAGRILFHPFPEFTLDLYMSCSVSGGESRTKEDALAICQHKPFPACIGWVKGLDAVDKSPEPRDWTQAQRVKRTLRLSPAALYVVNWLPDPEVTSDRNSLLLSKALPILWNPSFRLLSAASQSTPFFWERWDIFEHLYTIVCRALQVSSLSAVR